MTAPIVQVIQHYHPNWEPPKDNPRYTWLSTRCPFHDEDNASASVSYKYQAFNCFGCNMKGDVVGLIMRKEGISRKAAEQRTESLSVGGGQEVSRKPQRKSRRITSH